jgi:hypothetical protein
MNAAAAAPLAAPLTDGSPSRRYTLWGLPQTKIDAAMAQIFLAMLAKESGVSARRGLYSRFAPSVP